MSRFVVILAIVVFVAPLTARGILIDNGLAPPNPANIIDESNSVPLGGIDVRDSAAGSPTIVEVVAGASVYGISTHGASKVTVNGGTIAAALDAYDSSTITIFGDDFSVNGHAIGYGPVPSLFGDLAGTLAFGESFALHFCHDGCTVFRVSSDGTITPIPHTGTIILAPEPGSATLLGFGCVVLHAWRRRGHGLAKARLAF